jgi:PPOX class probable F420-dependent enzyme
MTAANLDLVREIAAAENHLAVVALARGDGSVHASVVNAGVIAHPVTDEETVAFVTYGRVKLATLRSRPRATVVFRAGWRWVAVEGTAEIVGPDDPLDGFEASSLPRLLRDVFIGAGGVHGDWADYDRTMVRERRAAVLVAPRRVYTS